MTADDFRRQWPQMLVKSLANLPDETEVYYLEIGVMTPDGDTTPIRVQIEERH